MNIKEAGIPPAIHRRVEWLRGWWQGEAKSHKGATTLTALLLVMMMMAKRMADDQPTHRHV